MIVLVDKRLWTWLCSVEVLARIDRDCGGEVLKYCVENHSISLDFIWLVLDKFLSSILFRFPHFKAIKVYGFPGIWEIKCCRKWRLIFLDLLWTRKLKRVLFHIFVRCALFSNFIYGTCFMRLLSSFDAEQKLEWALIPMLI